VDILTKDGFEVENGKYLDEALIIRNPSAVQKMDAFAKGYFQVQDESSMLVAKYWIQSRERQYLMSAVRQEESPPI